ncbi:glycoside hydrolase N-terminal domain-containing protein [Bacteroidota bacterium]
MKKPNNNLNRQWFNFFRDVYLVIGIVILVGCNKIRTNNNERLWFEYPAEDWGSQALHLGNGFLGVSFYGGVEEEKFELTERTMWTGGPGKNHDYSYGNKTGGKEYMDDIRQAIVSDNIK